MKNTKYISIVTAFMLCILNIKADTNNYPLYPTPGTPITEGQFIIASGGEVFVTYVGHGTGQQLDRLFFAPSYVPPSPFIWDNYSPDTRPVVDLGSFQSGTVLEFDIYELWSRVSYHSGTGNLNGDNTVHAYVADYNINSVYVGFEDMNANDPRLISNPSLFDYQDVQYIVSGAYVQNVPEPSSLALAIAGGISVLVLLRKRA